MYGGALQASKTSSTTEVQQWKKVFMPRTKHNIAFFTGASSSSWESQHPELLKIQQTLFFQLSLLSR